MAEKLFMSPQELRAAGLSEPMIRTMLKLAEFVDTQTRLAEAEDAIDGKQAADDTLTALAAYNTAGLVTQTAADTFTGRTITAGTGISVTNGNGVAGNPTVASTITQYTDEMARDAIGAALVAGANVTITVNDGADTITVAASGGGATSAYIPLVTGSVPPVLISEPDGSLILMEFVP